jgi:hypothetical protein
MIKTQIILRAMDIRGEPTSVCICGCFVWNLKVAFDWIILSECISEIWSVLTVEHRRLPQLRSKNETTENIRMDNVYCSLCGNFASRCGCDDT